MDASWRNAILAQGKLVREQQKHLGELDAKVNLLINAVSQNLVSYQNPAVPLSLLVSYPNNILGETGLYKGFLLQCSLHLSAKLISQIRKNCTVLQSAH